MKRLVAVFAVAVITAAIIGCPKPEIRDQQGQMDTPQHHVEMGDRFAHKGDWKAAHREYGLALGLDPKYMPAQIREAVYYAQAGDAKNADEMQSKAWDNAGSKDLKFEYWVYMIQYHRFMGGDKWIKRCEEDFKKAEELKAGDERTFFFMGLAYKDAMMFSQSEGMFKKVIEINGKLREDANAEWQFVQKIVRARPGTVAGAKIALVKQITKADVAALFVEEMHLPELWQKRGIKKWEAPAFQTPGEAGRAQQGPAMPNDIADHPLRSDIEAVIQLGIRGLEVAPDGNFYPNKTVTRAEYAVMLEDIMIKVLNEPGLATRYTGEANSAFHDMRTDHWAYNASVVVSSRQVMPSDLEGNFKPNDTVAGVDALLVIRQLMDYLKIG